MKNEHRHLILESASQKLDKKIEALALRLFEQRMKESSMMPEQRAEDAIAAARLFYKALGGDE